MYVKLTRENCGDYMSEGVWDNFNVFCPHLNVPRFCQRPCLSPVVQIMKGVWGTEAGATTAHCPCRELSVSSPGKVRQQAEVEAR